MNTMSKLFGGGETTENTSFLFNPPVAGGNSSNNNRSMDDPRLNRADGHGGVRGMIATVDPDSDDEEEEVNVCPICLDSVNDSRRPFGAAFPCGHVLHEDCFLGYEEHQRVTPRFPTPEGHPPPVVKRKPPFPCPSCKEPVKNFARLFLTLRSKKKIKNKKDGGVAAPTQQQIAHADMESCIREYLWIDDNDNSGGGSDKTNNEDLVVIVATLRRVLDLVYNSSNDQPIEDACRQLVFMGGHLTVMKMMDKYGHSKGSGSATTATETSQPGSSSCLSMQVLQYGFQILCLLSHEHGACIMRVVEWPCTVAAALERCLLIDYDVRPVDIQYKYMCFGAYVFLTTMVRKHMQRPHLEKLWFLEHSKSNSKSNGERPTIFGVVVTTLVKCPEQAEMQRRGIALLSSLLIAKNDFVLQGAFDERAKKRGVEEKRQALVHVMSVMKRYATLEGVQSVACAFLNILLKQLQVPGGGPKPPPFGLVHLTPQVSDDDKDEDDVPLQVELVLHGGMDVLNAIGRSYPEKSKAYLEARKAYEKVLEEYQKHPSLHKKLQKAQQKQRLPGQHPQQG